MSESPELQPERCDTTGTYRYSVECYCPTYEGNLGPCVEFNRSRNGRCVYCDHIQSCHEKVTASVVERHFSTVLEARDKRIERLEAALRGLADMRKPPPAYTWNGLRSEVERIAHEALEESEA